MGKTRNVVERFYERFGANDLDGAFAYFAPECIAVGLSGPLDNSAHHAAAVALKKAMPDCHMELVRILEMDDEIYVTGRFKGTHTGDISTPLGPVAASGKELDLLFVDYFRMANDKIVECEVVRDRLGNDDSTGRGSGKVTAERALPQLGYPQVDIAGLGRQRPRAVAIAFGHTRGSVRSYGAAPRCATISW